MIYSFTFKNFCSFADKATIVFEDIRKGVETSNNMFCDTPLGARLSKSMIVVGPNASGKTNALKALAFISWFVRNSFIGLEGEKEEIPVDTFAFSEDKDSISEFEIVFEHNTTVYKYILHLCRTHVVKEELYHKEETQHFNYLFKRNWNPREENSDIAQRINLKTEVVKEILRKNVSLISAAVAIKNDFLTEISEFWENITSNVNRAGKWWDTSSLGGDQGLFAAAEAYSRNQDLFKKVVQFLKDIDLGLEGIGIEEGEARNTETGEAKKIYLPYGMHKVNEKTYPLPFTYESSGTKNMFVLLHFLFPAIEKGGLAVIDELEIDLHPHALPQIIELFANPETNPKNSQLLFTSHSLDVLNHLEKEQIILVEKKNECKSELYRLDDIKGVRRDDNIYAKYMAGAYGAVPNI
ncbi:ATP/GTP-binding protein [Candidatus Auribacterota bacterium]